MPFYEYQCNNCGHSLEAMQKVSDPPLKKCPHCGKPQLQKLMSAPVFRLKGGGWYETDFKSDQDNKRNLADRPEDAPKEDKKRTKRRSWPRMRRPPMPRRTRPPISPRKRRRPPIPRRKQRRAPSGRRVRTRRMRASPPSGRRGPRSSAAAQSRRAAASAAARTCPCKSQALASRAFPAVSQAYAHSLLRSGR